MFGLRSSIDGVLAPRSSNVFHVGDQSANSPRFARQLRRDTVKLSSAAVVESHPGSGCWVAENQNYPAAHAPSAVPKWYLENEATGTRKNQAKKSRSSSVPIVYFSDTPKEVTSVVKRIN